MSFITLEEYKKFAAIEGSKTDAQIVSLISAATAIVEDVLGYKIRSSSYEHDLYTRAGVTEYFLDRDNPIISKIVYRKRSDKTEFEVDPDDVIVNSNGKLEFLIPITADNDRIRVTAGYSTEANDSIKLATMMLVKYYYKEEYNKTAQTSMGGSVSYTTGKNLPPHVRTILLMNRVM